MNLPDSLADAQHNTSSSLPLALADEEFELHYQARRDLKTGCITGMEALLRWNHPEFGTVVPTKFLPLAEETGLILPIGRWVLRTACRQNVAWREQGLPRLSVAVNLSARQFFDIDLADDITSTLQENGMTRELLELEISESVLARDTRKTLPVLERLKKWASRSPWTTSVGPPGENRANLRPCGVYGRVVVTRMTPFAPRSA